MKRNVIIPSIIFLFVSCSNEENIQKQWIYDNLPAMVWTDLTYETLNSEYMRLSSSLEDLANSAKQSYYNDAIDLYYGNSLDAEFLREFDQIVGNSSYINHVNKVIADYETNCKSVIENLRINLSNYLTLSDSTFYESEHKRTDEELFHMLIGIPKKIPNLTKNEKKKIAKDIAINTFINLNKPSISSIEYKKDKELWYVRIDNAENQYVKFYLREDGNYDVEYSNSINANGEPLTDNTITTSLHRDDPKTETTSMKEIIFK